jgi:hypothetical protein
MGCGPTLFLGTGGHVTCSWIDCPNPSAVDQILADRETEHLVDFAAVGFTVLHPLLERLAHDQGGLWGCALHLHVQTLDGPPVAIGRYRAHQDPGGWSWERVDR